MYITNSNIYYKEYISSWSNVLSNTSKTISPNTWYTADIIFKDRILYVYINYSLIIQYSSVSTSITENSLTRILPYPGIYVTTSDTGYNAKFSIDNFFIIFGNTTLYQSSTSQYYLQRELTPYEIMENNDISYGN